MALSGSTQLASVLMIRPVVVEVALDGGELAPHGELRVLAVHDLEHRRAERQPLDASTRRALWVSTTTWWVRR